jgi:hypothetical protein
MEIRREVEGGYNFLIDQGKPPALPVDSQKFDISGSRHSGSVFEPESRVLKHAKTVRLLPFAI